MTNVHGRGAPQKRYISYVQVHGRFDGATFVLPASRWGWSRVNVALHCEAQRVVAVAGDP